METATLISNLLKIFGGLIIDIEEILELEQGSLRCDYEKVALSVKSRGLGVFSPRFPFTLQGTGRFPGEWQLG